jgi:agmatine/peptidylarginine deiminase
MKLANMALLVGIMAASLPVSADEQAPMPRPRKPMVMVTADELANPDLYYPRIGFEYVPPPIALPAPPPAGSLRPGEFEQMDSTIITVIGFNGAYEQMWTDMVDTYSNAGHTWIIAHGSDKTELQQALEQIGVPQSAYSFLNYPVNTIWIRDYGPEFAVAPDGERIVFDADYSHRPLDDVVPQLMAASDWIGSDGQPLDFNVSDHMLSGGNMMTDGAGTCFFSDILYGYEKPSGWTNDDVDDHMLEYLGCVQTIVLTPICNDGTGHIDLYSKFMSPTSVLLGEFPPDTYFADTNDAGGTGYCGDSTPNDYQDQEDNLAVIEASTNVDSQPFVVTRQPLLEPYEDGGWWVYRSYMNSEIFNNWVAMPSYYAENGPETAEELLDIEALAIASYEAALPGVNVVPIDSDHIIPLAGAIHCISHEIPEEAGGSWEPPTEYCGDGIVNGDEECDGDDFGGQDCEDLGHGPGDYLMCTADCTIDDTECPSEGCGDGVVSGNEECDPCAPEQELCADYGLGAGELGCNLDCTINPFNCADVSPCEAMSAFDGHMLCCPEPLPDTCNDDSWPWGNDPIYGCCTADLGATYWCQGSSIGGGSCGSGICQYIPSQDWLDCSAGDLPEAAEEWPEFCGDPPSDQDAGPDAGPGGKSDDGCGCSAAGQGRLIGLVGLVLSLLLG